MLVHKKTFTQIEIDVPLANIEFLPAYNNTTCTMRLDLANKLETDWPDNYKKLLSYANLIIQRAGWLRKKSTTTKGRIAHDFVMEAIEKACCGERDWNPTTCPDYLTFLKGAIRSLISNARTSPENKLSTHIDISESEQEHNLPISHTFPDQSDTLYVVELKEILEQKICELNHDDVLNVYLEMLRGNKSREISVILDMDIKDVYNAQKRIRRIVDQYSK